MAFDSAHPLFQTTDTFQQLIQDLNYYGDLVDSNFRYVDSAIGPGGTLVLNGLDNFTANTLVDALNELDSDIHGVGGGSGADLNTDAKTLVDAINEIESVFDASAGTITTTGALGITSGGDLTADVTGAVEVDASGRIVLDAGTGEFILREGGTPRVTATLGATNTFEVNGNITWDVSGDITLDAAGDDVVIADNGSTIFAFNTSTPSLTVTGNFQQIATGTMGLFATGDITIDAAGDDVKFADGGVETYNFRSNGIISRDGDIALDVTGAVTLDPSLGTVNLKKGGLQYAAFEENGSNLIIKTGTTTSMSFSPTNVLFAGNITMPASGTGSPHTAAKTVAGALAEVNARIPNVYDRNGTLLNP